MNKKQKNNAKIKTVYSSNDEFKQGQKKENLLETTREYLPKDKEEGLKHKQRKKREKKVSVT